MRSSRLSRDGWRPSTAAAALVWLVVIVAAPSAQIGSVPPTNVFAPQVDFRPAAADRRVASRLTTSLRVEAERVAQTSRPGVPVRASLQSPPSTGSTSLAVDIGLGVGGAVGGFFGGGLLGYVLDRDALGGNHCECDSPGFKGLLWGAFIGAIALPIILIHWLG